MMVSIWGVMSSMSSRLDIWWYMRVLSGELGFGHMFRTCVISFGMSGATTGKRDM